jgi:beta-lactam-binding protein with PASTA domain
MKKFIQEHPIISNLLLMLLIFAGLTIVIYFAMDFGTRHSARRTVPDFVGLTMEDAEHFADRRDLEVIANDSLYVPSYPGGVVLEQHPLNGTVVKPGRKVYVTISSINQRKAVVPYVANRTLRQALHLLETAGFSIEKIQYVRDITTNYVLAEFVNGEEIVDGSTLQANVGSGVVLRVGVAAKATALNVPQLNGLTLFEAKHKLWETGLNVGEVTFDPGIPALERDDAKVYYQSIKPMKGVWYGESVSLRLALEKKSGEEPAPEVKPEPKSGSEAPAKVEAPKAEAKPQAEPKADSQPQPEAKPAPQQ